MKRKIETAWAAGLFEGEGTITGQWAHGYNKFYPKLSIKMTDKDVIERFAHWAGDGNITVEKKYQEHHKDAWRWTTSKGETIRRLLALMLPYFGERRAYKALNILDFFELDDRNPNSSQAERLGGIRKLGDQH